MLEGDAACKDGVKLALENNGASPPLQAYGLSILASVYLQSGRADKADTVARDALQLLDALGGVEEGEAFIRLMYAESREAQVEGELTRQATRHGKNVGR